MSAKKHFWIHTLCSVQQSCYNWHFHKWYMCNNRLKWHMTTFQHHIHYLQYHSSVKLCENSYVPPLCSQENNKKNMAILKKLKSFQPEGGCLLLESSCDHCFLIVLCNCLLPWQIIGMVGIKEHFQFGILISETTIKSKKNLLFIIATHHCEDCVHTGLWYIWAYERHIWDSNA